MNDSLMRPPPPARIGDSVRDVQTPGLVLDLDAFERNLMLMANAVGYHGLALRPHAKSHKCVEIAKAQVARGAIGICCQKVDEAAVFVAAGIANVLVTNEVVTPAKMARLPRERFVPQDKRHLAYSDACVHLEGDRYLLDPRSFAKRIVLAVRSASDRQSPSSETESHGRPWLG